MYNIKVPNTDEYATRYKFSNLTQRNIVPANITNNIALRSREGFGAVTRKARTCGDAVDKREEGDETDKELSDHYAAYSNHKLTARKFAGIGKPADDAVVASDLRDSTKHFSGQNSCTA